MNTKTKTNDLRSNYRQTLVSSLMNKSILLGAVCASVFTLTPTISSATTLNMTTSLPDVTNVASFSDVDGMLSPNMVNFDGVLDTIIITFNNMKFVELAGGTAPDLSIGMGFLDESGMPPAPDMFISIGTLSLLGASQEVIASSSTMHVQDPSGFAGDFAFVANIPGTIKFYGLKFEFTPLSTGPAFPGPLDFSSVFGVGGSLSVGTIPIPTTVWLFSSALGLLGWVRRKPT